MKYLSYITLALAASLASCDNIDDVYQYDDDMASTDWNEAADLSTKALVDYFWNADRGYFNDLNGVDTGDGNNYWPQAHAMDVVIDAYKRTSDRELLPIMDKWYEGIKRQSYGSYFNTFYDDEEWIALTMVRLFEVTGDDKYMQTARMLWDDIKNAWNDEYAGGGIAWNRNDIWSKNACSNGPAALLGCRLYDVQKNTDDLEWAKKIYDWMRNTLFNPATGAVADNINGNSGEINYLYLSYNQGTFMASAHYLYKFTGESVYLKDARRAANFCISDGSCIDASNNVIRDEGDGDGALFKGIFMRYFVDLANEPDLDANFRRKFNTFFKNSAEIAWSKGIADKRQILYGPSWSLASTGSTNLRAMVSGCTLMEARTRLNDK